MARTLTFLHYLPAFEAVARLRSVRGAAQELNLSPGAISFQMKKLGEATGITLFEKDGRNVALTPAGSEFAQAVLVSLGHLESATRTARSWDSSQRPVSLTVSIPAALGIAWLTAALVEFAEVSNVNNLTINEAVKAEDVDWETTDLAIVYDNPPFAGLHWRSLKEVRLGTVCSPILFPKLDFQRRGRDLNGITLLHEDDGEEWARWAIAARVSLGGTGRVRVASVGQAVASAVQGRGMALVSDALTKSYLAEGRLIQPFSTTINAGRGYYIVCPEARAQEGLIQGLIDRTLDYLRYNLI
jgi:LysR family glycine cleavage system transcriptional activator